ncbi:MULTISPECIES: hypothetical protein [Dermacoccus]|nr:MULTISPECIES: hypothetical protein [Dermacoccus]EFP58908.1 hypothetical protein HMPREF0321_2539 [Dermacoccus sp. Ellin185]NHC31035.1 hypothetical protein [Dermacoccus nishinomiyaensis]
MCFDPVRVGGTNAPAGWQVLDLQEIQVIFPWAQFPWGATAWCAPMTLGSGG